MRFDVTLSKSTDAIKLTVHNVNNFELHMPSNERINCTRGGDHIRNKFINT